MGESGPRNFKYNLKDLPNRWDKFNPEFPPYKFMQGRSRSQTMRLSVATLVGSWFFGFLAVNYCSTKQDDREDFWAAETRQNMSLDQKGMTNRQNEAFRDIFLKARRERLGLSKDIKPSLDMKDPYDNNN
jgi:hypothetical protein